MKFCLVTIDQQQGMKAAFFKKDKKNSTNKNNYRKSNKKKNIQHTNNK